MVKEIVLIAKKRGGNYPIGTTCSECGCWTAKFDIDLKSGKIFCPFCLSQGRAAKDKDLFLQGTYRLELNPEVGSGYLTVS